MTTLSMSISGIGSSRDCERVLSLPMIPKALVEEVKVEHQEALPATLETFVEALRANKQCRLFWEDYSYLSFVPQKLFSFGWEDTGCPTHFTRILLGLLPSVSFQLIATGKLWSKWQEPSGERYLAPGFANQHHPHGWACAFKGKGHQRLVSRRWLNYGPWRLIRDEETDLSFVQFHDLEADAKTALEQAKPGHQRMGLTLEGGFISKTWLKPTRLPERGFYRADRKVVEYVITGVELETQAYYEATQARYHASQAFNETDDVENIAFVFLEEDNARKHLHELWLRELECWAIIEGENIRLDDTYKPPPPAKPTWVSEVELREP